MRDISFCILIIGDRVNDIDEGALLMGGSSNVDAPFGIASIVVIVAHIPGLELVVAQRYVHERKEYEEDGWDNHNGRRGSRFAAKGWWWMIGMEGRTWYLMTKDARRGAVRCHAQLRDQVMDVKAYSGLRKVRHRTIVCCRRPASKSVLGYIQGPKWAVESQNGQHFPDPGSGPTVGSPPHGPSLA